MSDQLVNKIRETRERLQNHAIAKKIFDLMRELRTESNVFTERRWVWELLQNAKDSSYKDGISIMIEHDKRKKQLTFSHSGHPFSIDNIVGLIEQIGTKERTVITGEHAKLVGKFGTGFLTTHLLSEKVHVNSYLEEPAGKFIKFDLDLDRGGRTLEEVSTSVNVSIGVLEKICKESSATVYNPDAFNTSFTYYLNDEKSSVAETGITDLAETIPYTLVFVDPIKEVVLSSEKVRFVRQGKEKIAAGLELVCIHKEHTAKEQTDFIYLLICVEGNVSIALPVLKQGNKLSVLGIPDDTPRIFCEFPLVGTEDFKLPFIINSSDFNPTKDRNGIALTDKNDPIVLQNKQLFTKAMNLFKKLLDHISVSKAWSDTYLLANVDENRDNHLVSASWYSKEIIQPLKNKILNAKIVNTIDHGRESIIMADKSTIDFPYHKDHETLDALWELCSYSDVFVLPVKNEIRFWKKISWLNQYRLSPEKLVAWVASNNNIENLSKQFSKTIPETIQWLNNLVLFLIESELDGLINRNHILPDQNGNFAGKESIYLESEPIAEELKNIADDLGKDFRSQLLHNDLKLSLSQKIKSKKSITVDQLIPSSRVIGSNQVAGEIEHILKNKLKELPRTDLTKSVSRKLLQWFSLHPIESEKIFGFLYKERHLLRDDNEIIQDMHKAETLDMLIKKSGCTQDEIEQLVRSNDTLVVKVSRELYPESEDAIEQSLALTDNSDERSRITLSQEAKLLVFEYLKKNGFHVSDNLEINYTIVDGIINPEGIAVKIVVKSGKGGRVYFNPMEWLVLSIPGTQLFVVSAGNIVRNVTIDDLEDYNNTFHMRFNTKAFSMTNVNVFARFFNALQYTHFIFDTPLSTSDLLRPFGLNEKNPSANDLSPDNIKLLS